MFSLHPQLAADTISLGHLPLCQILLARDARYPWLIAVPQREQMTEIFQLEPADQQQLQHEVNELARLMFESLQADKMNIAALGNQVPQLHVHIIARFKHDGAWPGPVWGALPPEQETAEAFAERQAFFQRLLSTVKTHL